jgi:hypothetical protein
MWKAVQVTFNIDMTISVMYLFNDWANDVGNRFKKLILVGVVALYYVMWTKRNNMVFDKSLTKIYMHIL